MEKTKDEFKNETCKISLFKSFGQKGMPHFADEITTVNDFLNSVKLGVWKDIVEPIRMESDKEKRKILKKRLPSITLSGLFEERKEDLLQEHSGFICIDIDYYTDKTQLINDPYSYAVMQSVSGLGLAVVVKINKSYHKESFRFLQNYYFIQYGISVDSAPQNVASLRFVTYDPELYINDKSKVSQIIKAQQKKQKSLPIVLDESKVSDLVNEAVRCGKNLAPDYDKYINLGFALADGFGNGGRDYFHALCRVSEKYDSKQADKQYDECLKNRKSGITVGTFYFMLQDAGIEIKSDTQKYVSKIAIAKKSNHSKDKVIKQLVEVESVDLKQATELVETIYQRDDINTLTVTNGTKELIENLIEWLQMNHNLKRNSITGYIEDNGIQLSDTDINTIYLAAAMCFNSKDITKSLIESIIHSKATPTFNPFSIYFESNSHRYSTGNIDKLCNSIESNTNMKDVFIRKWFISLIAAYEGHPVRSVLALIGGQYTGKTEWFRRLLPKELKQYYGESKLDSGKDDEMLMCQKLILMDDEMGGKSKKDEKKFKDLTSKDVFSLRRPYGKSNEDFKRLAVLCGTTNEHSVINDPTGNTRILPIEVLSINHDLYNSIDKDELLMEAFREYKSGSEWNLNKDERIQLSNIGSDFETISYERELICKFFKRPDGSAFADHLTATEIKDYIELNSKQQIKSSRFSTELRNILGVPKSKKINGNSLKRYEVIKINS